MKEFIYKHSLITLFFALVLCFCAGFFGAYMFENTQSANAAINKTNEPNTTQQETIKVGVATKFIYIRKYTKSQTVNIEEKAPPEMLVGADQTAVSAALPDWKIEGFTTERVTFSREIESYSPGVYKVGSIIENNDEERLCVYEYDIDGNEIVKQVFETPIAVFDETEMKKIRDGIIVIGDEALKKILENYAE